MILLKGGSVKRFKYLDIPMLIGGFILSISIGAQAQDVVSGSDVFNAACAHCHDSNGQGTQLGPSILKRVGEESESALIAFLRTGSPERGMPPAAVTDAQMPALVEHLNFLVSSSANAPDIANANVLSMLATNKEVANFKPIDDATLLSPSPNDWLWFSRTPDAQRFSPLDQVQSGNVNKLGLAWSRGLQDGLSYAIPLVYDGVMYVATPASTILALDATTGDKIWEYQRTYANPALASQNRSKTISIYQDLVFFTAPDSTIVALDARTGIVRWEATVGERGHSSGSIVVKGMVVSGGNCIRGPRENCFISAHNALTGELIWKFNTVQSDEDSDADTWANVPVEERLASPWGLPGSYDPQTDLIYWGIANPMPTARAQRHGGDPYATAYSSPSELYSNSTVAINPDTGELVWYYQHLPGDDWDLDMNQERTLVRTPINPNSEHVRWINPNIAAGTIRDVVVNVGEGGGLWVLDGETGEFIWATPFPFDAENFFLSDIDVNTGQTFINQDYLVDIPGERQLVCYLNTRSFWPTAYSPENNSLYVPYIRNCLDMTSAKPATATSPAIPEQRIGAPEPGVAPDEINGLAKVNLETGEITHWPMGRIPTNSAILSTAGNLIFWGDIDHNYRAMDAETGAILWETRLGGPISMSNITYSVDGRQYVAVIAGETLATRTVATFMGPLEIDLEESTGGVTIYVFALPQALAQ